MNFRRGLISERVALRGSIFCVRSFNFMIDFALMLFLKVCLRFWGRDRKRYFNYSIWAACCKVEATDWYKVEVNCELKLLNRNRKLSEEQLWDELFFAVEISAFIFENLMYEIHSILYFTIVCCNGVSLFCHRLIL